MSLSFALSSGFLLKLILLDLTLGISNAALIVPACLAIPAALRRRAVILGTVEAIALRATALVLASFVAGLQGVNLMAGIHLMYSGYRLAAKPVTTPTGLSLQLTLPAAAAGVAIADLMMSVDNILVLTVAAHRMAGGGTGYAIAAACVSIPVILLGSDQLAKVIHRIPALMWLSGALLGFWGCSMALSDALAQRLVGVLPNVEGYLLPLGASSLIVALAWRAHQHAKLEGDLAP